MAEEYITNAGKNVQEDEDILKSSKGTGPETSEPSAPEQILEEEKENHPWMGKAQDPGSEIA